MGRRTKITLASIALVVAVALTGVAGWASLEYAAGRDPFAGVAPALATTVEASEPSVAASDDASPRKGGSTSSHDGETTADPSSSKDGAADGETADAIDGTQAAAGTAADERPPASDASSGQTQQEPSAPAEPQAEPDDGRIEVYVSVDASPAGGGSYGRSVSVAVGASAYDALLAASANVNARATTFGIYVAAIDGIAEKEHGPMSGWVYAVNGVEPNTAASNYALSDGDSIAWTYVNVEY